MATHQTFIDWLDKTKKSHASFASRAMLSLYDNYREFKAIDSRSKEILSTRIVILLQQTHHYIERLEATGNHFYRESYSEHMQLIARELDMAMPTPKWCSAFWEHAIALLPNNQNPKKRRLPTSDAPPSKKRKIKHRRDVDNAAKSVAHRVSHTKQQRQIMAKKSTKSHTQRHALSEEKQLQIAFILHAIQEIGEFNQPQSMSVRNLNYALKPVLSLEIPNRIMMTIAENDRSQQPDGVDTNMFLGDDVGSLSGLLETWRWLCKEDKHKARQTQQGVPRLLQNIVRNSVQDWKHPTEQSSLRVEAQAQFHLGCVLAQKGGTEALRITVQPLRGCHVSCTQKEVFALRRDFEAAIDDATTMCAVKVDWACGIGSDAARGQSTTLFDCHRKDRYVSDAPYAKQITRHLRHKESVHSRDMYTTIAADNDEDQAAAAAAASFGVLIPEAGVNFDGIVTLLSDGKASDRFALSEF